MSFGRGGREARLFAREWLLAFAFAASLVCAACQKKAPNRTNFAVFFEVTPQPPRVGPVTATVVIDDPQGKPIAGAHVTAEADMSHAGMSPVFADAKEIEPGRYQSTLKLSMGGDWVILFHGSLPGGETLERQFDLRGVRPN
ncbi:MAG TPA: FixH family protein [Candidatus Sulfotelmatobacter sp.]